MQKERIIELPKITDERGTLSFAEIEQHIPFRISQVSWITTDKQIRKQGEEIFIALTGSFNIVIDGNKKYVLDRPQKALFVPDKLDRTIKSISDNAIFLVISSESEKDKSSSSLLKEYFIADCPVIRLSESGKKYITNEDIPFDIKRIFYISGIPAGEQRGMHAHKFCHEILIAINGKFNVELDDGTNRKTVILDNPAYGLHIPPGIWAVEREYSQDVVCLVLASDKYDADNYINTYSDFIKYRQDGN